MKRRIPGWALAVACASVGFSGCELFHHEHRPRAIDEPYKSEPEEKEHESSPDKLKEESPSSFFKGSRLPGAMSSEARDIERNLGVH